MDSIIYNGEHSIIFNGKDSWRDWDLVPASRAIILPPELNVKEVEIPGRSGKVDLSNYLAGHLTYRNRSAIFDFYSTNGSREWPDLYETLASHLLGKDVEIILSDDPRYYYHGRCNPVVMDSDSRLMVQITADLDPFKRPLKIPGSFKDMNVEGQKEIKVNGTISYDSPTITTDSDLTVSCEGEDYEVQSGTHCLYALQLGPGSHSVTIKGTAKVTFDYRGGIL